MEGGGRVDANSGSRSLGLDSNFTSAMNSLGGFRQTTVPYNTGVIKYTGQPYKAALGLLRYTVWSTLNILYGYIIAQNVNLKAFLF